MIIGKTPRRFHRLSGAYSLLRALPFAALLVLASCHASSSPATGNGDADSLLDNDAYVNITSGEFQMGSPNQPSRAARLADGPKPDERPQRRVLITKPFEIGKYEVTQEQWQAVMRSNPSSFKGVNLPVTNVSWNDAQEFIARLQSLDERHDYRLPTEAEWEYACRAGNLSGEESKPLGKEAKGERKRTPEEEEKILQPIAWFSSNAFNHPHPVGHLKPNARGLHDMRGNVREWCQDWYDSSYYKTGQTEDPQGPPSGAMKVNRGGDWQSPASMCRPAARDYDLPTERNSLIGFRLVRTKR